MAFLNKVSRYWPVPEYSRGDCKRGQSLSMKTDISAVDKYASPARRPFRSYSSHSADKEGLIPRPSDPDLSEAIFQTRLQALDCHSACKALPVCPFSAEALFGLHLKSESVENRDRSRLFYI